MRVTERRKGREKKTKKKKKQKKNRKKKKEKNEKREIKREETEQGLIRKGEMMMMLFPWIEFFFPILYRG